MSEAKPTPGVWRVKEIERTYSWDYSIESTDEYGNIWSIGKAIGIGERGGEAEANAHLMAAAPELLEAAKECFKHAYGTTEHDDALDRLYEVVAKAEGRE